MDTGAPRSTPTTRLPAILAATALGIMGLGMASCASAQDGGGGDVTIYRCTGADGQVVIGNVPCGDDARQEIRSMVRPVDGTPATPPPPAAPAAIDSTPPVVRYVASQPPQPLYECMRPDGSTYESDDGMGEIRWVPAWTSGWPIGGGHGDGGHGGHRPGPGRPAGYGSRGATTPAPGGGLSAPPVSRISIPSDPPRPDPGAGIGRPRPPHGGGWAGTGPGVWERDACQALPAAETCARLSDRLDVLGRRFFNAQQVERDTLRVEERGLRARIDRDCRTY